MFDLNIVSSRATKYDQLLSFIFIKFHFGSIFWKREGNKGVVEEGGMQRKLRNERHVEIQKKCKKRKQDKEL